MKRMYWLLETLLGGSPATGMRFRTRDDLLYAQFEKESIALKIGRYRHRGRTIRYLETGVDTQPLVLFVHGAPGTADAFVEFLKDSALATRAHMISVDRSGHGYSDYGRAMISIEQQAEALKPLLAKNQAKQKPMLFGHSFGGAIVVRLAMDYPDLVGSLILGAPAIDPDHERIWWISYPANWKLFRWLVPRSWRVTNDEKLAHVAELRKMLPLWERIRVPTTVIHGERDKLVPVENAYFARNMLVNAPVNLCIKPDLDHLFPWTHPYLIKEALLHYLDDSPCR